jgi:hypothetical protein
LKQNELGLTRQEFLPVVMELNSKGFVALTQQAIAITFPGIREVERVESDPDHGTDYFPAINLLYVEQASYSQIQQATNESTQSMQLTTTDLQSLTEFVQKLEDAFAELKLVRRTKNKPKRKSRRCKRRLLRVAQTVSLCEKASLAFVEFWRGQRAGPPQHLR